MAVATSAAMNGASRLRSGLLPVPSAVPAVAVLLPLFAPGFYS
jgi:hypothetical protein